MARFLAVSVALLALLNIAFARTLLQGGTAVQGCQQSPGTPTPPECSGTFSGNQWSGDEIECHLAEGYQLKCEYDTELVGQNKITCQLDQGPLSSEIDFECRAAPNCQIDCGNFAEVKNKVPGATFPAIQRILTTWKAKE